MWVVSIVPDGVHSESRLRHPSPGHSGQVLILPAVNLQPSLLIVSQGNPIIAPVAGGHGIAVPATGGCGVEADLANDGAVGIKLEGGDVARQVKRVGPRRSKEVCARVRESTHVGAVHGPSVGKAGRDERVAFVRVHGHVGRGIHEVFAYPVAPFHEGVQVVAGRVHGDPSGVVSFIGAVHAAD